MPSLLSFSNTFTKSVVKFPTLIRRSQAFLVFLSVQSDRDRICPARRKNVRLLDFHAAPALSPWRYCLVI